MAPADAGPFRRPPFSTEGGTALHTAISSENLVADRRSIAPLNTSLTPQNTPSPWSFTSHPSPSSLPSPSYQHTPPVAGQSNHPSPDTGPAQSPSSSMIGPTPTYYDPDKDSQPHSQDYSHWIGHYTQVFPDAPLYPQPSAADPGTERPMQPPQHMDRYQFVNTQASSDTTFPFFPPQNRFDGRPGPSRPHHNPSLTTHTHGWPQGPTSDHPYIPVAGPIVQATFTDTIGPIPPYTYQPETVHGSVLTPASEATLPSAPRSPAVSDIQHLPTGTGTSNTPTAVTLNTSPRQERYPSNRTRNPKRRKADTDTDDDEDTADANVGANLPRTNRLPGACTYCKRLKMKCTFPPGENVCKRCRSGKHNCIVEGRKPRSAPNKREYLLAQLKQKDAIIESLLKQLHNPYLATPLSIEAYRMATSSGDHHRQNVIAWLDRLQSTVRSSTVQNPFQLDARGGKGGAREGGGESDESDEDQTPQQHAALGRASSDSDDAPVSPNTLVDSDVDPYPDDAVPLGLLAKLSISTSQDGSSQAADRTHGDNANADDDDVGVASKSYFMPGPAQNLRLRKSLIDKTSVPDILVHKLVTPDDVDKLFEIFYKRINPFISLLVPELHTPALTFSRCPFLFTVVCAIASRYSDKPEVYPIAMHFAKSAAAQALVDGWKSVELCQAYILMSIYAVPARRWEEDRSWLYTGLAIRIATDLNLHVLPKPPTTKQQELEMLNRTRVWMICFNIDKSTATQFGKPSTLKEDYIMRNSLSWYQSSQYNHPYDVHIIGYSSLFRIVNRFHQEVFSDPNVPNGLNRSIDFRAVTLQYDQLLTDYREEWAERFSRDSDHTDPACQFRVKLLPFYANYARLVMFSFGFQKAFEHGFKADDDVFFNRSLESAKAVVTVLVDSLVPTGYIRFAPDGYFVFAAFASAFMLKLLRPECSTFITPGLEAEIYQVIERLVNTIGSPQIAIDERHTPKLYSRFLASLLAKHKRDGAARERMPRHEPPTQQPQAGSGPSMYQQQQYQQAPPSHNTSSSSFGAGGSGANTQNVTTSMTVDHEAAAANPVSVYTNEPIYPVDAPQFAFGIPDQPSEITDFTFDTISAPGSDDMLATMQAIHGSHFWGTMMMPGFSWPTEESTADHHNTLFGNGMAVNTYQNFQPQPAQVLLG